MQIIPITAFIITYYSLKLFVAPDFVNIINYGQIVNVCVSVLSGGVLVIINVIHIFVFSLFFLGICLIAIRINASE